MRIYGGRGRGNLGYVNVYLMCSNPEINDPVRFYVDTGASRTTIADRDAIRLGLDYDHLEESPYPSVGIGCRNVKTYVIKEVALVFDASGNAFHIEKLPVISVLKHEPQNDEERKNVDQIPSLLGIDLLQKYSVRFTKTHVVLEK